MLWLPADSFEICAFDSFVVGRSDNYFGFSLIIGLIQFFTVSRSDSSTADAFLSISNETTSFDLYHMSTIVLLRLRLDF